MQTTSLLNNISDPRDTQTSPGKPRETDYSHHVHSGSSGELNYDVVRQVRSVFWSSEQFSSTYSSSSGSYLHCKYRRRWGTVHLNMDKYVVGNIRTDFSGLGHRFSARPRVLFPRWLSVDAEGRVNRTCPKSSTPAPLPRQLLAIRGLGCSPTCRVQYLLMDLSPNNPLLKALIHQPLW